jgi:hypothetical protein
MPIEVYEKYLNVREVSPYVVIKSVTQDNFWEPVEFVDGGSGILGYYVASKRLEHWLL